MARQTETPAQTKKRLSQQKIPGWARKHDRPGSGVKTLLVLVLAIAAAAAILKLVFTQPEAPAFIPPPAATEAQAPAVAAPAAIAVPAPAPVPAKVIPIPGDERAFAGLVAAAAQGYQPGATDAAAAVRQRGQAMCQAFSSPHVSQWVGVVLSLSPGADRSVLEIVLDVQKAGDKTAPGPPILMMASQPDVAAPQDLNPGDTVTFTGDFIPDSAGGTCFKGAGQTYDRALQDPAFMMRFSDVQEAQ